MQPTTRTRSTARTWTRATRRRTVVEAVGHRLGTTHHQAWTEDLHHSTQEATHTKTSTQLLITLIMVVVAHTAILIIRVISTGSRRRRHLLLLRLITCTICSQYISSIM